MTTLTIPAFSKILKDNFPHVPTAKQVLALERLAAYVLTDKTTAIFLLKGYAGTGKTTLVGDLVTNLWKTKMKSVLMAPTGRAAKVMSGYSQTQAFTIHRKIYFPKKGKRRGYQICTGTQ